MYYNRAMVMITNLEAVVEMEREKWYTVAEAAEILGVHPQTVRRWLRSEQLLGTMLSRQAGYRIKSSEIDHVLERGLRQGKELAAA
jgi:excisionase family DNA binding protein